MEKDNELFALEQHIKLLKFRPSVLVRLYNILLLVIDCQEFKTADPKDC